MNSKNKITYIEPNSLPSQYAAKNNGVKLDNITWPQEDLNISVDLQVIVPTRLYKESNTTNYENNFKKESILSGVEIKKGTSVLTDDYTNISYQEIKNSGYGSKEMLGINSIRISFDSHMYPRVTMNFTDVRGASLMMPQEQFAYDIYVNKKTNSDNHVCENFFQSFFKFPYPRFLLSVKGVYGTCVTFVLSVEDFKATFNSESGNFDVVVSFIGQMYGLYTDIPMNYLIMAPYIGSNNNELTNQYWNSKTKPGGDFYYKEDDNIESKPISTFFDFRNNFKNLISLQQGNNGFVFGANITELTRLQEEISSLNIVKDYFDKIPTVGIPKEENVFHFETTENSNKTHILFLTGNGKPDFVFKEDFVKEFTSALDSYNEKYGKLDVDKGDLPGKLSSNNCKTKTINSSEYIFITNDKNEFVINPKHTNFYENISQEVKTELENSMKNDNVSSVIQKSTCAIIYTESFKDKILKRLKDIDERIASLESGASEDMKELFRASCNFTPTIENIMRMVFAHLDTFLHEFYSVLKTISSKNRLISDFDWDKVNTDILSSSSNNVSLPPFSAFFKEKNGQTERIYPGEESQLQNLEEVVFVEKIFNGLTERLEKEAENAQKSSNDIVPDTVDNKSDFMPIAITDFFYHQTNPYSLIENKDFMSYADIYDFILSRLYVGFRDFNGNDKVCKKIIENEVKNLKSSLLWNTILKNNTIKAKMSNIAYQYTNPIFYVFIDNDKKFFKKSVKVEKIRNGGKDYFKFDGLNAMANSSSYLNNCRENLDRFQIVEDTDLESNRVLEFKKSCDYGDDEYFLKKQIDEDNSLRREQLSNSISSVFLCLSNNKPFAYSKKEDKTVLYDVEKATNKKTSEEYLKNIEIRIPSENSIPDKNNTTISIENAFLKNDTDLWVPAVIDKDGNKYKNIFFDSKNCLFWDSYYVRDEFKTLWFLWKVLEYEQIDLNFNYKKDYIFRVQKIVAAFIGGYFSLENVSDLKKHEKQIWNEIKNHGAFNCVPKFVDSIEQKKIELKNIFSEINSRFTENILPKIEKENEESKNYKIFPLVSGEYRKDNFIPALSPTNRDLQDELVKILKERVWILSFPNENEPKDDKSPLLIFDKKYYEEIHKIIIEEIKSAEKEETSNVEELFKTNNTPISNNSKNQKLSLYYTLKNLYDKWLSTYSENNFKLSRDKNGYIDSEFNNFLYVDSFYNDIGKKLIVNPNSFYNLVEQQIIGNTNFNVYEFIGKICQDNKLIFRCLPVYNNLYSSKTFKEIFKPMSLYNGADKIYRKVGNTYLLMYAYEPSNKLNIQQDKTNDVSYLNDSFDFADTFGEITEEAAKLFKDSDNNICAFAVTPGAQNQSYFTKVSIGMDNPRVTDFAIKNQFLLAGSVKGGRTEGIGTGQDMFSIYSNRSYDCNVEMLGCADIMPMMYFQLNNVPMFKGAYMITKVEHNIQNNTMTTRFTGTRMSRYFIPYNNDVFNLQSISEIINTLKNEGTRNFCTIGSMNIELTQSGNIKQVNGENRRYPIPQPSSEPTKTFNVWAAVNQMAQCIPTSVDPNYVPLTWSYNKDVKGRCATAVNFFLMAGFNGVFGANNQNNANYINDNYRTKSAELLSPGIGFIGVEHARDMSSKLAALGFYCIACGADEMDKMAKSGSFQAGDVCVMRYWDKSKSGHICMYSGKVWVSDFKQNGWRENSGNSQVDTGDTSCVLLYRYPQNLLESKPQIYGYYKNDVWIDNHNNNNGYDIPEDALRFKNAVE